MFAFLKITSKYLSVPSMLLLLQVTSSHSNNINAQPCLCMIITSPTVTLLLCTMPFIYSQICQYISTLHSKAPPSGNAPCDPAPVPGIQSEYCVKPVSAVSDKLHFLFTELKDVGGKHSMQPTNILCHYFVFLS